MGIPRYFRYISERWPTISQLVNDNVIPEFDNLYLDMNSILHTCSHGNDTSSDDFDEDRVWVAIFNYIEHLFEIIKPKKTLYMAIDGVAPRAKLNQQRSRRFRSALDAETARNEAVRKGQKVPEEPFDTNSITPGTEFMARLTVQLQYFVKRKVTEDALWRNCDIVLSGHEVPGEGEHKVMNYIRSLRIRHDQPNIRHCLYGLDADLIMLGLSTHQPHFSLLREEVTYGRTSRFQSNELSEKRFFLLHLSLTREYLQLEFSSLLDLNTEAAGQEDSKAAEEEGEKEDKEEKETFNFERIIDDFVLINFFIGNDFLPELPMLLISEGALPVIYDTYRNYLVEKGDYITNKGKINYQNLKVWIKHMSRYQVEKFEKEAIDTDWFNNQLDLIAEVATSSITSESITLTPEQRTLLHKVKPFILKAPMQSNLEDLSLNLGSLDDLQVKFVGVIAHYTGMQLIDNDQGEVELQVDMAVAPKDTDGKKAWLQSSRKALLRLEKAPTSSTQDNQQRKQVYDDKYSKWRNKYYQRKFGAHFDDQVVKDTARNYLEGLEWVYQYYYRGCPSWAWYYGHHYAPMISELYTAITDDFEVSFPPSKPLTPGQQLMAVLPHRSRNLVPMAYRDLMTEPNSPIIDFYPATFETDLNGRKAAWEAVVLIPFIDTDRLCAALESRDSQLTDAERARSIRGTDLRYIYSPSKSFLLQSPNPMLPSIPECHCLTEELDPHNLNGDEIKFGLTENTKSGKFLLAGFPSLYTLDFHYEVDKGHVKVFEFEARGESVILNIQNAFQDADPKETADLLLDTTVYVDYPHLREVKVVGLSTQEGKITRAKDGLHTTPHSNSTAIKKECADLTRKYEQRGILIGGVDSIIHYLPFKGLKRNPDGSYVKEYSGYDEEQCFPLQLVVEDVESHDPRFEEREQQSLEEEYPVDSPVLVLLNHHYGAPAKVMSYTDDGRVNVAAKVYPDEVDLAASVARKDLAKRSFMSSRDVARILKVPPYMIGKLTSRCMFTMDGKKINLGIVLRNRKDGLKGYGYASFQDPDWTYSREAVTLLKDLYSKFGELLDKILRVNSNSGIPDIGTLNLSEGQLKRLEELKKFVKDTNDNINLIPVDDDRLSLPAIDLIERGAIARTRPEQAPVATIEKFTNVPRASLLSPKNAHHQLRHQTFKLGARVVYALDFGKVPFGALGSVVGFHATKNRLFLDVIFDHEFEAGSSLDGSCKTRRGLIVESSSLINLSEPQLNFSAQQYAKGSFIPSESLKTQPKKAVPRNGSNSNRNAPAKSYAKNDALRPARAPRATPWEKGTDKGTDKGSAPARGPARGPSAPSEKGKRASQQDLDQASAELRSILKISPGQEAPAKSSPERQDQPERKDQPEKQESRRQRPVQEAHVPQEAPQHVPQPQQVQRPVEPQIQHKIPEHRLPAPKQNAAQASRLLDMLKNPRATE